MTVIQKIEPMNAPAAEKAKPVIEMPFEIERSFILIAFNGMKIMDAIVQRAKTTIMKIAKIAVKVSLAIIAIEIIKKTISIAKEIIAAIIISFLFISVHQVLDEFHFHCGI